METIQLNRRLTHRYVGTYAHEDNWEGVGTARLTPPRAVAEGNGIDDGGTYIRWAILPAGQDAEASARALQDTLSKHGCHHEYDCCGCRSLDTRVIHRHGRRLVLRTQVSFNY